MRNWLAITLTAVLACCGVSRAQSLAPLPDGISLEPRRIAPPLFRPNKKQFSQAIRIHSTDAEPLPLFSLQTDRPWLKVQPDERKVRTDSTASYVVQIDARTLPYGAHTGSVILTTANWPEPVVLPVSIAIQAPISAAPATVVIYEDGTIRQSFLTLYSDPELIYTLTGVQAPGFLDVIPGRIEEGRQSYTLGLKEGTSPSTLHESSITFLTDSPVCPEVVVPVAVLPPPDYEELRRARRENRPVRDAQH